MFDLELYKKKMNTSYDVFLKDLSSLRSGKVSPSFLDPIKVSGYNNELMPISQVGSVNVIDANLLTVQVWDNNLKKNVEKAIRDSGLGLDPVLDGNLIRIPIPKLTEERRKELCKTAAHYAENSKITIRNIRKEAMEVVKKQEKSKEISEDEMHRYLDQIQKEIDNFIKKIDQTLTTKQNEITKI